MGGKRFPMDGKLHPIEQKRFLIDQKPRRRCPRWAVAAQDPQLGEREEGRREAEEQRSREDEECAEREDERRAAECAENRWGEGCGEAVGECTHPTNYELSPEAGGA